MYYLIYGFLYVLSLIPWPIMYGISDLVYGLIYYIIRYRKEVVFRNLSIAFPEKTEQERIQIAKEFYHNFTDTFIETIKLLSISTKNFEKRFTCSDIHVLNDLYATGQSVELVSGHYFNWEFGNLGLARLSKYPFLGVYMPLSNPAFNKIVYDLRSRYGTILLPATQFRAAFLKYSKETYMLGLVADQSPGGPDHVYWTEFFGKMTPFVKGPEKGAKVNNTAVIYAYYYKVKRGHYKVDLKLLTTDPSSFAEGQLTKTMIREIEASIRQNPANYLWSHRRWKFEFDPEKYQSSVV